MLLIVQVYYGRYINQHMLKHTEETGHKMVLSYADLSMWCFACDLHDTTHVQWMCTQSSLLTSVWYDIRVSPQILIPMIVLTSISLDLLHCLPQRLMCNLVSSINCSYLLVCHSWAVVNEYYYRTSSAPRTHSYMFCNRNYGLWWMNPYKLSLALTRVYFPLCLCRVCALVSVCRWTLVSFWTSCVG